MTVELLWCDDVTRLFIDQHFFFSFLLYINPKVNFIFLITFRLKFVWLNSYFNTILIVNTRQARSSNKNKKYMNAYIIWRCLGEQFNINAYKIKDKKKKIKNKIIIRRVCLSCIMTNSTILYKLVSSPHFGWTNIQVRLKEHLICGWIYKFSFNTTHKSQYISTKQQQQLQAAIYMSHMQSWLASSLHFSLNIN